MLHRSFHRFSSARLKFSRLSLSSSYTPLHRALRGSYPLRSLARARIHSAADASSSPPAEWSSGIPSGVTVVRTTAEARRVLEILRSDKVASRVHACDTEAVHVEPKKRSPLGEGRAICATIFCGGDIDFGAGPRLFVDNLTEPGLLEREFNSSYFHCKEVRKVWHNYSFDRHVLFNHGIDVIGFGGDTIQMARLWHAARTVDGGYSLEALASELLGTEQQKKGLKERFAKPKLKKDGTPGKLLLLPDLREVQNDPDPLVRAEWIEYSVRDAEVTWHLYHALKERLEAMPWARDKNMFDFYEQYWLPFGEMLTDMEREGIYVRAERLREIEGLARADRDRAAKDFLDWATKYCPDAQFMNVGSDAQKQQFFFAPNEEAGLDADRTFSTENVDGYIEPGKSKPLKNRPFVITGLGMPPVSLTKAKKPAVSMTVLNKVADSVAHDFFGGGEEGDEAVHAIKQLCKVSSTDTLITNFILPLQELADDSGRIHCSLGLNTETGRLSARRPNLQNQPALEKDVYKIRDCFAADPRDDNVLIVADYGQLELRLLAHMSKCKSMIDAFKAGGDFHSRTAVGMYPHIQAAVDAGEVRLEEGSGGDDVPLVKDKFGSERRRAKTLNFSIAYGKTAMGLAQDWNVSRQEAKETLERWYADRPEVRDWQQRTIEHARQTQATRTLMGRYRPLPDITSSRPFIRSHAERAAINTPIQGGAADVVMKAMLVLHAHEGFRNDLGFRIILQIHDEIVCEGPRKHAEEALRVVNECMERPFEQPLLVDLVTDGKIVESWWEAK